MELKLKLDLHFHCCEATGYAPPRLDIVQDVIARAKARGLDGIAITEHHDKAYAYKFMEVMANHGHDEFLIIPGQEIDEGPVQVVELYLPNKCTFRMLVHPGYPSNDFDSALDTVHGIEIANPIHDWHINKERVKQAATKYGLLLFTNSDAHHLADIGRYYNEIDLEDLYVRAKLAPASAQPGRTGVGY